MIHDPKRWCLDILKNPVFLDWKTASVFHRFLIRPSRLLFAVGLRRFVSNPRNKLVLFRIFGSFWPRQKCNLRVLEFIYFYFFWASQTNPR